MKILNFNSFHKNESVGDYQANMNIVAQVSLISLIAMIFLRKFKFLLFSKVLDKRNPDVSWLINELGRAKENTNKGWIKSHFSLKETDDEIIFILIGDGGSGSDYSIKINKNNRELSIFKKNETRLFIFKIGDSLSKSIILPQIQYDKLVDALRNY